MSVLIVTGFACLNLQINKLINSISSNLEKVLTNKLVLLIIKITKYLHS